jgi:hypothetical protein
MREIKLKILDNAFHCFDGKHYGRVVLSGRFGSVYWCSIFNQNLDEVDINHLTRLPECIDAEVREY